MRSERSGIPGTRYGMRWLCLFGCVLRACRCEAMNAVRLPVSVADVCRFSSLVNMAMSTPGASELPEAAEVLGAEPDPPPPPEGPEQEVPLQEPQVHQVLSAGDFLMILLI